MPLYERILWRMKRTLIIILILLFLHMLLTSCGTKKIWVKEVIPVEYTVDVPIPHYNMGNKCFPERVESIPCKDTLEIEYYYMKRIYNER